MIDRMGGLIRNLPRTSMLFLLAALAICGLPPFNGFISEVLIFSGLFKGIAMQITPMTLVLSVIGMALIGGLALLCFTKAFGIMFLGTQRQPYHKTPHEAKWAALFPKMMIGSVIVLIGLFPQLVMPLLRSPVALFDNSPALAAGIHDNEPLKLAFHLSWCAWALILIIAVIYLVRNTVHKSVPAAYGPTWGCGYVSVTPKLQYTASSFVKPYVKIIKPLVEIKKSSAGITDVIPDKAHSESHFYDKMEVGLVDWPTRALRGFLGKFKFLQNGSVHFYVLYGAVFIAICIIIPLIIDAIRSFVLIINNL
jgi:NADH:ubiquinone oxidoreductase subunit 5 (subunit L)/multisubunit Na+/H+ antiporter MnhA subunit